MFVTDFIQNGQGHGPVGSQLASVRFDDGLLRPFYDENGIPSCTVNTGREEWDEEKKCYAPVYEDVAINELTANGIQSPVFNATSLRKQEWVLYDQAVLKAARGRLRAWADLAAANMFGGFNGMAKLSLEHETMTDPGEAMIDMDGLTAGRTDSPRYQLQELPLPITHSDFWFSERRLAVSRNTGTPLDTTMAEATARRVAEMVEKITIGVAVGMTQASSSLATGGRAATVFGYTNFTNRLTYTSVITPTGTNPDKTLGDVLAMRDLLYAHFHYGPFIVYHSNDWDKYLDNDYYALASSGMTAPSQTLRNRLRAIEGISDVRRLDFFTPATPFQLLMVEMQPETARAVSGMDFTTLQWESQGGMRKNFKVMCINVPQLRADANGNCGLCHGTTS